MQDNNLVKMNNSLRKEYISIILEERRTINEFCSLKVITVKPMMLRYQRKLAFMFHINLAFHHALFQSWNTSGTFHAVIWEKCLKNKKKDKERGRTCVTVTPQRALISRVSFLPIVSLIEKMDCMYFTAFGFSKSLGFFPGKVLTQFRWGKYISPTFSSTWNKLVTNSHHHAIIQLNQLVVSASTIPREGTASKIFLWMIILKRSACQPAHFFTLASLCQQPKEW